ncbi:MAG: class I SAM-dependent methyltransferase [Armatimonadetes bacterium]|nr:class I SAM-dependent methyltransferase [Armatimonadota bacterium]
MEGFGTTERFVEVPWCLHRRGDAHRVLDIGYANADNTYLQSLANLQVPELYGLDIAPVKHITVTLPDGSIRPLLTPVQGDVRETSFPDNFFDLIYCISTIEHIGMDNTGYRPATQDNASTCGDFEAIRELCRIVKPGGRLLVTVPFGKYQDHGWFQQYDMNRLMRLVTSTDFQISETHFFAYRNGWKECYPYDLKDVGYQSNSAVNAAGLACVELCKAA